MDRFKMIFQYFQSNSESVMNGICGLLALASVKIYNSLDFNCPCLPKYNMIYGMGIMFVPPVALFLCGLIVNRQSVIMMDEWMRPTGRRKKDLAIVKYMCTSVFTTCHGFSRGRILTSSWMGMFCLCICGLGGPDKIPRFCK
ncbi:hypothetical protein GDO81_004197 [Engystomops pustulosus]|uniref:Uncharacterized protein n=1 Tax=Engystomops pustulosus TaxID=76066 RepID=A0AAV6ZT85_ENGPU|nr:hypothetical protein GDO81_004197 [Engystomops pustulosus]